MGARRYSLPRCWGLPEGSSFLFLPPGPSVNGGNRPLASTPITCHTTRLCQTHTPRAASHAHQPSAALSPLAGGKCSNSLPWAHHYLHFLLAPCCVMNILRHCAVSTTTTDTAPSGLRNLYLTAKLHLLECPPHSSASYSLKSSTGSHQPTPISPVTTGISYLLLIIF